MRRRDRTSPTPQDTKEIIQFKHIYHEQVAEQRESQVRRVSCEAEGSVQEASNIAWCFGGEEQQKRVQSISEHQTEVGIELDDEEEKGAEIKNQVQTAKNSPEAQQHRAATASKDVAER